jgi:putative ABC transport system substrate-binding protein
VVPIVFVGVGDPIGVELVKDLARPGGNITGITNIVPELTAKRLEILKEIFPHASRVAVLVNQRNPNAAVQLRNAEAAAKILHLRLEVFNIERAAEVEAAIAAAARSGAPAALRMVDPTATMLRAETARSALKHRLGLISPFREDAQAGALVAYGSSLPDEYAQAALFVHKIFQGAKPGDLPIERPTKFEFVINNRTAKALGLTIPKELLLRADEIIE